MNLLQASSPGQNSPLATSNQADSSLIIGHSLVNSKGYPYSFLYKCCNLNSWIIDSEDSDHICSTSSWFHAYNKISPINVKLPNGHFVLAKDNGIVKFSSEFYISNVLYIYIRIFC